MRALPGTWVYLARLEVDLPKVGERDGTALTGDDGNRPKVFGGRLFDPESYWGCPNLTKRTRKIIT